MNYNVFFIIAGCMWGIELIPQLIKTLKTKKVEDISLFFPFLCLSAYLCFFIGCIGQENWMLLFSHLLPFVNLTWLLILILKYRKKK